MSSDLQSSLALPTAQTPRRQEPNPQSTLAAAVTTVVDVHAIIPDPDFGVDDDAIAAMLEEASGPYRSVDVRFRLAGVERTNEPLLTRDQGSDIPTSGPPLHIEMPRQARAVRYPGKLVIFFRLYHDSPAFKAFSYSSYWADYVVMGEVGAAKFAHEAGHYFNLSHTHNDASTGRLDQVNRDLGFQATLNEAVDLMRLAQGSGCFDGDFPAVRDTPPDPGPPLFQPTGNDPSEHCTGTRTLRVPGLAEPVTLAPDRRNVMSYFGGCQATDRGRFSPDQATIVRATLLSGNRRQLASGVTFEGPAVTALSSGAIQVFARGDDRAIWRNVWPGKGDWSGWRPDLRGGTLTSGPAAVTLTGDHVHVFARGDDRDIWHNWMSPGGDWVGWRSDMPSGGATFSSAPAATVLSGGEIHLFARGDDRNIWHNWWPGPGKGDWVGWTLDMRGDGATFSSAPAATVLSGDEIQVFARGDDRAIWRNVWPGKGDWSGWRPDLRGGTLTSGPAAVTLTGDHVHVFARGDDRDIWHNWMSPGGDWVGWRSDMPSGGATFTSGPAGTVLKGDKIHLFTEGDDRNIWHNSWLGQGNWTGWTLDMNGDGATFMW